MSNDSDSPASEPEAVIEPEAKGAPDSLMVLYQSTLRTLGRLPEIPMRRAKLDEVLKALSVEEAAWWIDQLVRGALWGKGPEIDAMLACTSWLIELRIDDNYEYLQALYAQAHESKRDSILVLLRDIPPHHQLAENARLPEVKLPTTRDVTLGEKRWLAAGADRKFLERLIYDYDPMVIEKLLKNPHVNLQDVLIIASRRPTKPDILLAVAISKAWFKEHQVREAVAQNPYSPTGIALKILPTLRIDVLRKIRNAGDLHPSVHQAADMFVNLREQRTAPWGY